MWIIASNGNWVWKKNSKFNFVMDFFFLSVTGLNSRIIYHWRTIISWLEEATSLMILNFAFFFLLFIQVKITVFHGKRHVEYDPSFTKLYLSYLWSPKSCFKPWQGLPGGKGTYSKGSFNFVIQFCILEPLSWLCCFKQNLKIYSLSSSLPLSPSLFLLSLPLYSSPLSLSSFPSLSLPSSIFPR